MRSSTIRIPALLLTIVCLLCAGCNEKPQAKINLGISHIHIRMLTNVDYLVQRQGTSIDMTVQITNICNQPVILKSAGTSGQWDEDENFFPLPADVILYSEEHDDFKVVKGLQEHSPIPVCKGLLWPGESTTATLSSYLAVIPSETKTVTVSYYVLRDDAHVSDYLYRAEVEGLRTYYRRHADTIARLREAKPQDRDVVMHSSIGLVEQSDSIDFGLHPERLPEQAAMAADRAGLPEWQRHDYYFCRNLDAWVFQDKADCLVVFHNTLLRVTRCALPIFAIADRAQDNIAIRITNPSKFIKQSKISDIDVNRYEQGDPATLAKHEFQTLLQESYLYNWQLSEKLYHFNTPGIQIDNR